jgi:hypothetical protein
MRLAKVELVLAIEEIFGVDIPDAAAEALKTPRNVAEYILSRYRARGRMVDHAAVERRVLTELAQLFERPLARVTLDSDLAELAWFPQ